MKFALLALLLTADPSAQDAETLAQQALASGNVAEALAQFEIALRAADDTANKARLRDLYLKAGWAEPPPVSRSEEIVLGLHVAAEKMRLWSRAADDFERAKKLHAAIVMRRAIIEDLAGGPDTQRGKQEVARIRKLVRNLTENPSEAERAEVDALLKAKKSGASLLRAGRKLLAERRFRVVVRLCQELMIGTFDQQVKNEAAALRKRAEDTAVSAIAPVEADAALAVIEDERFERLAVERSRHFLFLGPKKFVESIPAKQRTMLDLAYIHQSDLAQQDLTADGVRMVIYYQETFDFGGGLAGGKLIRIGNRAIRLPIAGMLHYHELGHLIFGRGWLHAGFTEGLADFAAGFTLDALGQTRNAQQFIQNARDQFVRYFLGRAVRYFDIQPYRPSAGFLFSFLPPGEAPFDWASYRRVFRRMREAQFGNWPAREHQLMRFFGYLLATEYGDRVYDTLGEWGWPVERADRSRVPPEASHLLSGVKQGEYLLAKGNPHGAAAAFHAVVREAGDGWIASRARYGILRSLLQQGDMGGFEVEKRELGIVDDFWILGPFHARRQTAYVVFPPETHLDLAKREVRFRYETATWRKANVRPDGFVDLRQQGFGYPEHACAFALAYVNSDRPQRARVWLGSDDGHTLYVNNELAEKRDTHRSFRFDDDFADVQLRTGWNRLLVKVHNTNGAWGFLMRVTRPDGRPLPGVRFSAADLEAEVARFSAPKLKTVTLVNDDFRSLSSARWAVTVGKFDSQNGRLRPRGTAKTGLWLRFKVDPDKPKDGPANIVWLKSSELARAGNCELEIVVAAPGEGRLPAKFGFTLDGENENDGQSGHTFVIEAIGEDKLRCHWYRYDHLLYLQPEAEVAPAPAYRVRLRRIGSKWWLSVNDVPLFEEVDAPRLPALGFGLLTWGRGPEFESVRFALLEPVP